MGNRKEPKPAPKNQVKPKPPPAPPKRIVLEHNSYELALLRDIRTLLAFQLERDILLWAGKGADIKELDEWIIEYIKQNRIL